MDELRTYLYAARGEPDARVNAMLDPLQQLTHCIRKPLLKFHEKGCRRDSFFFFSDGAAGEMARVDSIRLSASSQRFSSFLFLTASDAIYGALHHVYTLWLKLVIGTSSQKNK